MNSLLLAVVASVAKQSRGLANSLWIAAALKVPRNDEYQANLVFALAIFGCSCLSAQVIVDSQLWQASTHIYLINTQYKNKIELYDLTPAVNVQDLANPKNISIPLPEDLAAVQDVALCGKQQELLLVLTVSGQLLGIDINTKRINFSIQLADYFPDEDDFSGAFALVQGDRCNPLVLVNSASRGVLLLPDLQPNLSQTNVAAGIQFIAAPIAVSKIINQVQILQNKITKNFFSAVETNDGCAIWQIDTLLAQQQLLHLLKLKSLQGFGLIATKQSGHLNAFAVYAKNQAWFIPYLAAAENLNLPVNAILGENIQQLIVGPAIATADCSWYLVDNTSKGIFVSSNNFSQQVALPANTKIFLRHAELVFFSTADAMVYSVQAATGRINSLPVLHSAQYILPAADELENTDFLFWDPQNMQHVLFSIRGEKIYLNHFALAFDKPKILSWRLQNVN